MQKSFYFKRQKPGNHFLSLSRGLVKCMVVCEYSGVLGNHRKEWGSFACTDAGHRQGTRILPCNGGHVPLSTPQCEHIRFADRVGRRTFQAKGHLQDERCEEGQAYGEQKELWCRRRLGAVGRGESGTSLGAFAGAGEEHGCPWVRA